MGRTNQQFQTTKTAEIPRSSFDLSHGVKTVVDSGLLVPILSLEVLPGDTISCRASLFGRLATPIRPVIENIYCETFFFYTPMRQLWSQWPNFMGEQANPGDSTDYVIPTLDPDFVTEVEESSIYDYMGLPLGLQFENVPVSALPFRNYNAVYNFWFRDQNLIPSLPVNLDDGPDTTPFELQRRRKRRDYITSGLPWPQKGESVTVNLGGLAPVQGIGTQSGSYNQSNETVQETSRINPIYAQGMAEGVASPGNYIIEQGTIPGRPAIFANLAEASGISINDLRESFQIQKLLERDARGGTRYPEILQSHFRVTDPGLLVHQRPLYLGGGSTMVNINPVPQTQRTDDDETPQGNLAAFGTVSAKGHGFTSSFTEHGLILGLVNFRADLTYQQGLERYFSRQTRYDFYWPVLSHLGEQMVANKELYVSNDPDIDGDAFAYMPRYDEYRFKQSLVTSIMRSGASASLDVWHLAQDFSSLPSLNQSFIEDNPPMGRISAVPSEPDFLLDVYFKIRAARPLPMFATPGLIDHF